MICEFGIFTKVISSNQIFDISYRLDVARVNGQHLLHMQRNFRGERKETG